MKYMPGLMLAADKERLRRYGRIISYRDRRAIRIYPNDIIEYERSIADNERGKIYDNRSDAIFK